MKTMTSFTLNLATAVLIVLASATIAGAGEDTCAGLGATIGGTCIPLTNTASSGNGNTAFGGEALSANTTGNQNTATGAFGLDINTTGDENTASGYQALEENTTGSQNSAAGDEALLSNTTGGENTANGYQALEENTTGSQNSAAGDGALLNNTTGSSNIGIGVDAGRDLTTGDNNIDIFDPGVASESNTIRIGTQGTQTDTYIAGIFGTPTIKKACEVVVETTGRLGCVKSSARYKRDIRDMGDASDKLMKLRPVSFTYKADSTGTKQYGLIAEEVEKVYPELVIDDTDAKPEAVAYQVLPAMLLNEVQKQAKEIETLTAQAKRKDDQIASQQKQIDALKKKDAQIDALAERMNALERQVRLARPEHLASAMR
jgi:hypothetical protein